MPCCHVVPAARAGALWQGGLLLPPQVPIPPVNENSKYTGGMAAVAPPLGSKKAGPPPGRKMSGSIDVIGGGAPSLPSRRPGAAKEGVIQVRTLPPLSLPASPSVCRVSVLTLSVSAVRASIAVEGPSEGRDSGERAGAKGIERSSGAVPESGTCW